MDGDTQKISTNDESDVSENESEKDSYQEESDTDKTKPNADDDTDTELVDNQQQTWKELLIPDDLADEFLIASVNTTSKRILKLVVFYL